MTQRLMQDEDELPTFANIQLKRSFIHISCALFMCLLKGTLMLQKPLDAGSSFSPQCHYESVKIKTQPQAGSQPNSAN